MEHWKEIAGFESQYEVSNKGQVRIKKTQRVLCPSLRGRGYEAINLHKDGKQHQKYIHRLVAEAFIDNPDNLPCVNHKDENKTNNQVSNLEWCSYSYNNSFGTRMKRIGKKLEGRPLSEQTKRKMSLARTGKTKKGKQVLCVETGDIYESAREASRALGLSKYTISGVCSGKGQTAKGCHWRYL